jgi:V8-like Glu-specific endopeptidase
MKRLLLVITLLLSLIANATTKQVDVIYGKDNRKDVYESTSTSHVELSRSAAGMISFDSIKSVSEDTIKITGPTLTQRGICSKERFSKQITAARCSGFLIGPDLLATAGHCVRSQSDCDNHAWVFDYALTSSSQTEIIIPKTNVYKCKEIIKTVVDNSTMNDFAIIKLNTEVKDRPSLSFRKTGKPSVGDNLVVIGCPTGLPLKISDGAKVRTLLGSYFTANLDTYGGNSGSAVFNADTGIVEGILVRGENDYVRDPSGCMISNICADNTCRGEDVTYSSTLVELFGLRN